MNLGYSEELARQEAMRCLECAKPTCTHDCPVGVKVKEFVQLIVAGDFLGAAAKIREDNVLPAITGRVCPQEDHCEGGCLMGKKVEPLGIGYLERFVADYEQRHMDLRNVAKAHAHGKEGRHRRQRALRPDRGGRSRAKGTPGSRLRSAARNRRRAGLWHSRISPAQSRSSASKSTTCAPWASSLRPTWSSARTVTIDELMHEEGYDAVFIGTGAGLPQFMGIPGEHLNGVYSANEFLTRINLMHAYEFPRYDEPMVDFRGKNVAVIGGGNTALDAIRSALRLGAGKAYMIYRRSEAEMPARKEEVKHAKQEGIEFQVLAAPIEFLRDGKGWLHGARCLKMELGEAGCFRTPASGADRRLGIRNAAVRGRHRHRHERPIRLIQSTTPGLDTNKTNYIEADPRRSARRAKAFSQAATSSPERHGDSGHGRGPAGGKVDPRVLD